jgi:hypothetical protein
MLSRLLSAVLIAAMLIQPFATCTSTAWAGPRAEKASPVWPPWVQDAFDAASPAGKRQVLAAWARYEDAIDPAAHVFQDAFWIFASGAIAATLVALITVGPPLLATHGIAMGAGFVIGALFGVYKVKLDHNLRVFEAKSGLRARVLTAEGQPPVQLLGTSSRPAAVGPR